MRKTRRKKKGSKKILLLSVAGFWAADPNLSVTAVEVCLLHVVFAHIDALWTKRHAATSAAFAAQTSLLRGTTLRDLGAPDDLLTVLPLSLEVSPAVQVAIATLRHGCSDRTRSTYAKMRALSDAVAGLVRAVPPKARATVSADGLLPMTVWLAIHADCATLPATLSFVHNFALPRYSDGPQVYYLATLEAATAYIADGCAAASASAGTSVVSTALARLRKGPRNLLRALLRGSSSEAPATRAPRVQMRPSRKQPGTATSARANTNEGNTVPYGGHTGSSRSSQPGCGRDASADGNVASGTPNGCLFEAAVISAPRAAVKNFSVGRNARESVIVEEFRLMMERKDS